MTTQDVVVDAVLRDRKKRTTMVQLKGSKLVLTKDQLVQLIEDDVVIAYSDAVDVPPSANSGPEATSAPTHYEPAKIVVRHIKEKTKGRPTKATVLAATGDATKVNNLDYLKEIELSAVPFQAA